MKLSLGDDNYLEIALKGQKVDGLIQKSMVAMKGKMDNRIKEVMKNGGIKNLNQVEKIAQPIISEQ